MSEQFVFQVDDQGFRFCPVALLPRKRNQSVDFAFRCWLAKHGNPDASYQVLEVVSPRISVFVREIKDLEAVPVSAFVKGADENQK